MNSNYLVDDSYRKQKYEKYFEASREIIQNENFKYVKHMKIILINVYGFCEILSWNEFVDTNRYQIALDLSDETTRLLIRGLGISI